MWAWRAVPSLAVLNVLQDPSTYSLERDWEVPSPMYLPKTMQSGTSVNQSWFQHFSEPIKLKFYLMMISSII